MSLSNPNVVIDGGTVVLDPSSSTAVSNFPAVQPVSATALPLPTGASTEATLAAIKAKTDNLDVALSTRTKPSDVQAVSGPLTDTQLRATPVPVSTTPLNASTATSTQVVLVTNTNATALAANASRKKVIIYAPKNTLYIKLGATASATSFAYIVTAANTTLELTGWVGQIDVLSTVGQTINVTELV